VRARATHYAGISVARPAPCIFTPITASCLDSVRPVGPVSQGLPRQGICALPGLRGGLGLVSGDAIFRLDLGCSGPVPECTGDDLGRVRVGATILSGAVCTHPNWPFIRGFQLKPGSKYRKFTVAGCSGEVFDNAVFRMLSA